MLKFISRNAFLRSSLVLEAIHNLVDSGSACCVTLPRLSKNTSEVGLVIFLVQKRPKIAIFCL
jgi:hypothetical protein